MLSISVPRRKYCVWRKVHLPGESTWVLCGSCESLNAGCHEFSTPVPPFQCCMSMYDRALLCHESYNIKCHECSTPFPPFQCCVGAPVLDLRSWLSRCCRPDHKATLKWGKGGRRLMAIASNLDSWQLVSTPMQHWNGGDGDRKLMVVTRLIVHCQNDTLPLERKKEKPGKVPCTPGSWKPSKVIGVCKMHTFP